MMKNKFVMVSQISEIKSRLIWCPV